MLDFITYYNGGNFNTSGTRTRGSRGMTGAGRDSQSEGIQMKSFRSVGRSRNDKGDLGYASGTFNGDARRGRGRDGNDEGVMSDGDSQEMIIRKDMDIDIRVDSEHGKGMGKQDYGRPNFM
jgi:hypothetical protein